MFRSSLRAAAAAALFAATAFAAPTHAAPLTGTFITSGDVTGTGPWTLTTTGVNAFGFLGFVLDTPVPFSSLSEFIVNFESLAGGSGGGSPRGRIQLDVDGDTIPDGSISVYFGTAPSYIDSVASLNTYSGLNFIGNNDTGRYDTSAFGGGSPFTDYASALALLGTASVLRLGVVVDTFQPFPDFTIRIDGISGATAASVPEPGTLLLLGVALAAAARTRRGSRAA
jgi:hypothetical protein